MGPPGGAAFGDGPDIWEIIETYLLSDQDLTAVWESWPHLPPWKISTAIRFYERFPADIEERVRRNNAL